MPLDPQVQQWRERRIAGGVTPLYSQSLAEARAADLADIQASSGDPEAVHHVSELSIEGSSGSLPLRVFRPGGDDEPLPVLVYFFGGGWTLGQIDTCDAICRTLANRAGCVVIAAGYRLAPEHKFPAAVHDCFDAVRWIADNAKELGIDEARIAVGGDSAGANLAAAVTLLVKERGGPAIASQLLVYPNTLYGSDTQSMRDNDDPSMFNRRSVDWYWGHYLDSEADGQNPLASPLLAPDLSELPPALVITAEYDPLRDESEQYAHALQAAGVTTELSRYDGMMHGFFTMSGLLDGGRQAVSQAADFLRTSLGSPL